MSDLKTQLAEDIAPVTWESLLPHAKRDALIVVEETIELLDVGEALAQDDTNSVQNWINTSAIHKPTKEQLATWNNDPTREFTVLILQPFVLIKESA